MKARLLLGLGASLAALLAWMLAAGRGEPPALAAAAPDQAAGGPRATAAELAGPMDAGDAVDAEPDGAGPSAAEDGAAREEQGVEEGAARAPLRDRRPVVVRVRLALASGEAGAPGAPGAPSGFGGWPVVAQSWVAETNETHLHETSASAAGVAELVLPGPVHVDWVRCTPPPESGLALAFAEHHVDLEPGDVLDETLELDQGATIAGRVVDLEGAPVAGARVHATSSDESLEDWQPGLAVATSAADGTFRLPPLPSSDWYVSVEPADWLQLDPPLGSAVEGRSSHALEAGDAVDAGDLCVARLHRLRVLVLDAAGRPAPGALVRLQPLDVAPATIGAREPDPFELFLGRAEPPEPGALRPAWTYEDLSWTTDAEGGAEVLGIAGAWELVVEPALDVQQGASVRLELRLPSPDQRVVLPAALLALRGRVVDEEGRGIEGAWARLERRPAGAAGGSATDAEGRFAFAGLPPGGDYVLMLSRRGRLQAEWAVRPDLAPEEPVFVLRTAGSVRVKVVDAAGAPVAGRPVSVLAVMPEPPLRPCEQRGIEAVYANPYHRTDAEGRVSIRELPSGRVELGLRLPFRSEGLGRGGMPRAELRVFARWVVPVGDDEEQRLVADLSGYAPPVPIRHTGVVLDEATGAPLAGARVLFRHEHATWIGGQTDAEGRFGLDGPGDECGILVAMEGYLAQELSPRRWPLGEHEHRFLLRRGGRDLEIQLADREGVPLPTVEVGLRREPPSPYLPLVDVGLGKVVRFGGMRAVDGVLRLVSVPPGTLHLDVRLAGHALGTCTVEVGDGTEPQRATARLERSLAELRAALEGELEGEGEGEEG